MSDGETFYFCSINIREHYIKAVNSSCSNRCSNPEAYFLSCYISV